MYFSNSKLNAFLTCPHLYKLKYVDKLPTKETSYMVFGTALHESIAKGYLDKLQVNEIIDFFDDFWQTYVSEHDVEFYSDGEFLKKLEEGREILATYYKKVMSKSDTPILVEYKFGLQGHPDVLMGKHKLTGIIDLVNSDAKIIDFKSSATKPSKLEMDLDIQMTFYSFAFRQIFNRKESGVAIYNLRGMSEHDTVRSEKDFERLNLLLDQVEDAISSNNFYKRITKDCGKCSVVQSCLGVEPVNYFSQRNTWKKR
jgi:hypothetical protein